MIDWSMSTSKVSTHFSVHDLIYLPQWSRLANETDGLTQEIKDNLVNLAAKMEVVRHFLGDKPIVVHCGFRPTLYNTLVKGATHSTHLLGMALDWHCEGLEGNEGCDKVRDMIKPHLEEWSIRCEDVSDKPSRGWVHIDFGEPHPHRYFIP